MWGQGCAVGAVGWYIAALWLEWWNHGGASSSCQTTPRFLRHPPGLRGVTSLYSSHRRGSAPAHFFARSQKTGALEPGGNGPNCIVSQRSWSGNSSLAKRLCPIYSPVEEGGVSDPGGPGSTPGGGEGLNPGRDVERGVAVKTPPSAMCGTPSLDICAHPSYHH